MKQKGIYKKIMIAIIIMSLIIMGKNQCQAEKMETKQITKSVEKEFKSSVDTKIVKELINKRTGNTNTYLMSDGTKKIEVYSNNIRYKENGRWNRYDKSLIKVNSQEKNNLKKNILNKKFKEDIDLEQYTYVNKKGDSKQYFAKKLGKDNPIIMNKGKHNISYAPIITENSWIESEGVITNSEKSSDRVVYTDKNKKIEYTYISLENGVKEDIKLFDVPNSNIFQYTYTVPGMEAIKIDDNNIALIDKQTKDMVAQISAPYVIDVKGNKSYKDVTLHLEEKEDGIYVIQIIVNAGYLKQKEKYPVTVDPTVNWNGDVIYTGDENRNQSNGMPGSYRFIAGIDSNGYEKITYMKCDDIINKIKGKYIQYAIFMPTVCSLEGKPIVSIRNIESKWGFTSLYNRIWPQLGDEKYYSYDMSENRSNFSIYMYITEMMQKIAAGNMTSYGIALKSENKESGNIATFYGREEKQKPIFAIGYSEPIDVEAAYDGSFEICEESESAYGIEFSWEEYNKKVENYYIYARENESNFKLCGITEEMEYVYTPSENAKTVDIRVMAVDSNATDNVASENKNYLSNIITYKKMQDTSITKEGKEIVEYLYEPANMDTDKDELEDGYEIWDLKTKWNDKDEKGNYILDSDRDGFSDGYEVFTLGTDPIIVNNQQTDSDSDGIIDIMEEQNGTDPWLKDTDFDGYIDSAERECTKTNGSTSQAAAEDATTHIGKYDIEYSEIKEGVVYTYIVNIYRGDVKSIYIDYNDNKLNKHIKYFYDGNGNNIAVIESYDDVKTPNHEKTQTICTTYKYDNDNITFICDQNTKYSIEYDKDGNMIKFDVGNCNLLKCTKINLINNENETNANNEQKVISKEENITQYGNNDRIKTITTVHNLEANGDSESVETEVEWYFNDDVSKSYVSKYNSDGNIVSFSDYTLKGEVPITYTYDYTDDRVRVFRSDGFNKEVIISNEGNQRLITTQYTFKDIINNQQTYKSQLYIDAEDNNQSIRKTKLYNGDIYIYENDETNGIIKRELYSNLDNRKIYNTMKNVNNRTNISYQINYNDNNKRIDYIYDLAGNITQIKIDSEIVYKYLYDAHGRLEWQMDIKEGISHKYIYNSTGNILADWCYQIDDKGVPIKKQGIVKYYTYGYDENLKVGNSNWSDQLTTYDGQVLTYDGAGNPKRYIDGMNFTWNRGRVLDTITFKNGDRVTYKYNEGGLRTLKDSKEEKTIYEWDGESLIRETVTFKTTNRTYDVWYLLDNTGSTTGFEYSYIDDKKSIQRTSVYYEKNLQGDVIGLLDSKGTEIATYSYDAWGNITDSQCCEGNEIEFALNHITYRGYYRDNETKFYYLQSRYFDPVICRFINPDSVKYIGASDSIVSKNNFYVYCNDNPMNFIDTQGCEYESLEYFVKSITSFIPKTKISFHAQRRAKNDYFKVKIPWSKSSNYEGIFKTPFKMGRYKFYKKMGMTAIRRKQYITVSKMEERMQTIAASVVNTLVTKDIKNMKASFCVGYVVGDVLNSHIVCAGRYKIVQTITYAKTGNKPELYDMIVTLDAYKREYTAKNKAIWVKYRDKGLRNTSYLLHYTKNQVNSVLKGKLKMY